jgi:hypothetical protein
VGDAEKRTIETAVTATVPPTPSPSDPPTPTSAQAEQPAAAHPPSTPTTAPVAPEPPEGGDQTVESTAAKGPKENRPPTPTTTSAPPSPSSSEEPEKPEVLVEKPQGFFHSEDYASVTLRGQTFTLTSRQRQMIQILNEAYESRRPDVGVDYILVKLAGEHRAEGRRWQDIWRWDPDARQALIKQGEQKGTLRLNI